MSYSGKIYRVRTSAGDGLPDINLLDHPWEWDDWDELDVPFPPGVDTLVCKKLCFRVDHPLANEWDLYSDAGGGTRGIISQRAKDLLEDNLRECCNFLQTTVNEQPYYFLLGSERYINCWDQESSIYETYDVESFVSFKVIERLRFFRDQLSDPMVFRVPEYPPLLVTESIKQMIGAACLNGFDFVDCEDMLSSFYS